MASDIGSSDRVRLLALVEQIAHRVEFVQHCANRAGACRSCDDSLARILELTGELAALLPPVGQPLEPAKPGHVCGLQGYCPGYPHFDPPCPACVARYRS
jgi:hypothetical protein